MDASNARSLKIADELVSLLGAFLDGALDEEELMRMAEPLFTERKDLKRAARKAAQDS